VQKNYDLDNLRSKQESKFFCDNRVGVGGVYCALHTVTFRKIESREMFKCDRVSGLRLWYGDVIVV